MSHVVCFGEILLRLTPPERELLLQSPMLKACFGGAEANVAVSLAALGGEARMVSVLPDNALGRAARDELRRRAVDVAGVRFGAGRLGLYFVTPGAVVRPAEVLYDRTGSAFALAEPEVFDWKRELKGASALHLSGITPALGESAARAAIEAAEAANRLEVPVSFDCNYRAKLWASRQGDAPAVLRALIQCATVVFAEERDLALALGQAPPAGEVLERRRVAAQAAFGAFPRLIRIASTLRTQRSADSGELSAVMFERDGGERHVGPVPLRNIVERIGAGDAFAAGLLHALGAGRDAQHALEFALAAAALKHAIPGDFNLAAETDVNALLAQDALDVRR